LSKLVLIGDTHFGSKKNSDPFLLNHIEYIKNEFVPYLIKNNINTIAVLGDLYDNRNSINIKVKNMVYDLFENELSQFKIFMLVGNHDTYYHNSIATHSLKFFKKFNNINVIDDVERIQIDGKYILMVPWQTDYKEFADRVARKNFHCDVCLGHFDISGFKFNKTRLCEDGLSSDLFFNNYTLTFSGHFHTRSKLSKNNFSIVYIGAPYHLTRSDIGEERGFCVLDLEDLSYKFVNSKNTIKFVKISYPESITKKMIDNNVIDIHVKIDEQYKEEQLQKYIKIIESYNPLFSPNVVIEDNSNIFTNGDMKICGSAITMIKEYVDGLNINQKDKIYHTLEKLYNSVKSAESDV
jgi:DNA repair exonuclease SbcCD nuclease subunit